MNEVRVRNLQGDRFEIGVGSHTLYVDQPVDSGGEDSAPTPLELFIASLASCVAHYARRYLVRHDLPTEGLEVTASFEMASAPARVGSIRMDLTVPLGVPEERLSALHAVASKCTVHNTLDQPPTVSLVLQTSGLRA